MESRKMVLMNLQGRNRRANIENRHTNREEEREYVQRVALTCLDCACVLSHLTCPSL